MAPVARTTVGDAPSAVVDGLGAASGKEQVMPDESQPGHVEASLVDFAVLAEWMDAQDLPGGAFQDVEQLGGGTQNVLIRFRRGGRPYVLRRPPRHRKRNSNELLRREARVFAALADTDVPVPRLVASCPDESVLGDAVFSLMEPIEGFNPTLEAPLPYASDPTARHRMGLEAADAAARLGAVDYVRAGLDDLGDPDSFLARQVPRWLGELESYREYDGYAGPDIPGLDRTASWLDANRPTSWRPGIMHGDYHLGNLVYAYDRPRLAAIIDWEMCTIADPLLDLGWLLAIWPDEDAPDHAAAWAGALGTGRGLPTRAQLVAHYAERSGRDLSAITWYAVLACFTLGIVLEGSHARASAGKAARETGDRLHGRTLDLFAHARAFMEG